jgi:hypothetical protein
LKKGKEHPVSVKKFLSALSGKGKLLFLIFFVLPFSQIFGAALFFGPLICYLGLRIAFNKKSIWLPEFAQKKKIPFWLLKTSVKQILFGLKILNKWSRPRYFWATHPLVTNRLNGVMIAIVGISLALCPPVPLTGMIAFAAILFIGIGLLNDDGIYLILGYVFTLSYFVFSIFLLKVFSLRGLIDFVVNLKK